MWCTRLVYIILLWCLVSLFLRKPLLPLLLVRPMETGGIPCQEECATHENNRATHGGGYTDSPPGEDAAGGGGMMMCRGRETINYYCCSACSVFSIIISIITSPTSVLWIIIDVLSRDVSSTRFQPPAPVRPLSVSSRTAPSSRHTHTHTQKLDRASYCCTYVISSIHTYVE